MRTVKNKICGDVIIIVGFLIAIVINAISKRPFSADAYGLGIGMGWLVRDVSDYSLLKRVEEQMNEEDGEE